jgi:hypothetical protein
MTGGGDIKEAIREAIALAAAQGRSYKIGPMEKTNWTPAQLRDLLNVGSEAAGQDDPSGSAGTRVAYFDRR